MALGIVDHFHSIIACPRRPHVPSESCDASCLVSLRAQHGTPASQETSPSLIVCRQKRTSACHSLTRNADEDPTLDEGPGTETSQTSPTDGASLHLLQVDPRRRGGDNAAGLICPARSDNVAVGSISQQAERHGRSCPAAFPRDPSRAANEREAHVASQAALSGTADGDRVSAFTKDPAPRIG